MVAIHHDPAVRRMLFFTGLVVLAEPLAATMLLSFVVFMVRDFENVDERSVAFWCGMISKDQTKPLERQYQPIMITDHSSRSIRLLHSPGIYGTAFWPCQRPHRAQAGAFIRSVRLCRLYHLIWRFRQPDHGNRFTSALRPLQRYLQNNANNPIPLNLV